MINIHETTLALATAEWKRVPMGQSPSPDDAISHGHVAQLRVLDRLVQGGEIQTGWKLGVTTAGARARLGVTTPCFGYLLASGCMSSGSVFRADGGAPLSVEAELCVSIRRRLSGANLDRRTVASAIGWVAPAIEVAEDRGHGGNLGVNIADNAMHRSYVLGECRNGPFDEFAFDHVRCELHVGLRAVQTFAAEPDIDNPLDSIAWLAGALAKHGLAVEQGDWILTGNYASRPEVYPGEAVRCLFDPYGQVTVQFSGTTPAIP